MRSIRIGLSAALVALTIGCGNTADGMKEDTERNAEATARAADRTGNAVGDAADATGNAVSGAAETASVKAALIADSRVGALGINVNTDEAAKTITLVGTVTTAEQKRVAGEIATTKGTGYKIVNSLTIRP